MLGVIGVDSVDKLFSDVPEAARLEGLIDLPKHASEIEVERTLTNMSARTPRGRAACPSSAARAAYRHHVPATVDHLIQRSEFLTSYTPYQPEITQGTLQALYEFQTQVANLTGMDVANASMYDGSTATGEAVMMASRVTRRKKAILSGGLHPQYVQATETTAHVAGVQTVRLAAEVDAEAAVIEAIDSDTACVVVQTPNVFGTATDVTAIADAAHRAGALLIVVVTEAVSLGLLKAPGAMGADIVAAEGQSIGNALNFGGPLRRAVRLHATSCAPDARPAGGRDGGRGRPARLRADAVHARAAHPARQGDVEHLHQFRALRARLHHPHEPAGRGGAAPDGAAQPPGRAAPARGAERGRGA
jgi:glycine dehydrogenase subunit 1